MIQSAVAAVVERRGGVDVLVANAELIRRPIPGHPFEDIPVQEWVSALRVNIQGARCSG
ncbi:hypothetical protein [Nonomuraea sp. NPDC050643]|uniref:hypothetical protein n=1 Tax=Nonomuraea sp. NPDC050643 TaxID=3155660 RepID=UPI00340D97CB